MPATSRELRPALQIYCVILTGLTLLGWAFVCFNRFALHLPFPWDWPLFDPRLRFSDLTENYDRLKLLDQGIWGGPVMFVYPAPALGIFAVLLKWFSQPVTVFLIISLTVYLAAALLFRRVIAEAGRLSWLLNTALVLTVVCSYPAIFQMDRGNIEIFSFGLVLGGICCFAKRSYWAAAILIGLAGSIKPFPLLFLYLLLTKRLYKQASLALGVFLVTNLVSLHWIGPTIAKAYSALAVDQRVFFQTLVLKYLPNAIHFDHSLFSCIKQVIRLTLGWSSEEAMASRLQAAYVGYLVFAAVFGLTCLWCFRNKPVLNQLFAVTILVLVMPPVSYDYTLISVYIVWGAFMIHLFHDGNVKRPLLFLVPFAILMTPHPFLRVGNVGCGGPFNALLLLFLLGVAFKTDLPSSLFSERPTPNPDRQQMAHVGAAERT